MMARAEDDSVSVLSPPRGVGSTPTGASRTPLFRKRLKHWAIYALLRVATWFGRRMPLAWVAGAGAWSGRAVYRLDSARASVAAHQIAEALGYSPVLAQRLAEACYAHLGRLVVEVGRLPMSAAEVRRRVLLPEADLAVLREALSEGRGVVLASGHIGNWELLAQRLAAEGFDGLVVVRRLSNPYIRRWLNGVRAHLGLQIVERGAPNAARRIRAALRRGAIVGLLIDQNTSVASVDIPFFGRRAPTPTAVAALALRCDRPVVVGTISRRPDGRHVMALERIELPGRDTGPDRRIALTVRLNVALEQAIRAQPSQWVWFHDRWGDRRITRSS